MKNTNTMMINKKISSIATLLSALLMLVAQPITAAPTAEQIRQFKNLSPEQQTAIKESVEGRQKAASSVIEDAPVTVVPIKKLPESQIEAAAKESMDTGSLEEKKEEKKIQAKLEQFGYDLFAGSTTTFAPVSDIPIPSEYVIGPGDMLQLLLYGKENSEYQLQVGREGELNFPGIGPIQVAGMRFDELKQSLNQRIQQQMIGVQASITLGKLRSIRVFILGDVRRPGSYTVSALSTMTNALFVSGGVTKIGSLRNIQLKRQGKVINTLDLYDLLLKGDTSQDARIQPGDVLFVPPVGQVVGIGGEVRRPALYELKQESAVEELIKMSGGLLPTADLQSAQLERISKRAERIVLDLNLSEERSLSAGVKEGDIVRVYSVLDKMEQVVELVGHVQRSGTSQWFDGMRLSDLISSNRDLLMEADLEYLLIQRERPSDKRVEVVSASLNRAWEHRATVHDPLLKARDRVIVLNLGANRINPIKQTVKEIEQQESFGKPARVVQIAGNVRYPATYPLEEGMTVRDLVEMAKGVRPKTDMEYALLQNFQGEKRELVVRSFSLEQMLRGEENRSLEPGDKVLILSLDEQRTRQDGELNQITAHLQQQERYDEPAKVVSIVGNVRFPGKYPLEEGMSAHDLIHAAMGILPQTDMGYALVRRENAESHRIEALSFSLNKIILGQATMELHPKDQLLILSKELDENGSRALLNQLVAELESEATYEQPAAIVTITGEVNYPGKYPFTQGMAVQHLVEAAGGLGEAAYSLEAELTHKEVIDGVYRELSHELVPLNESDKRGILLKPYDSLHIRKVPLWDQRKLVRIEGEVQFPGSYPISRGETLYALLQRAGGLTEFAFPEGALFMREDLKQRERKQMDKVADQFEKQIASLALDDSEENKSSSDLVMATELLKQLRETEALGRMSIDLDALLANKQLLTLKGGDRLVIPGLSQEVTVLGEVYYPSSHMHEADKTRLDYVNMSGGTTKLADDNSVYVVRASGKVLAAKRIAWFRMGHDEEIKPGDTVVVPLDVKPTSFMAEMKDIAQILYQLATTTAALQTVGAI